MASWSSVKNFLHSNYHVQADNGGMMSLVVPTGDGRTQLVHVSDGSSVVQISSPVAQVREVTAEQVLRATEGKLLGVQMVGAMYLVASIVVLEGMSEEELQRPLWFLAWTADEMEQQLVLGDKY
ncbi:MAG: hypothetical protein WAO29_00570 [Candidatus Nanopelagicales bacterium]